MTKVRIKKESLKSAFNFSPLFAWAANSRMLTRETHQFGATDVLRPISTVVCALSRTQSEPSLHLLAAAPKYQGTPAMLGEC